MVILRLPFAPSDKARVELLRALLASRGIGGANAKRILFAQDRTNTIRKLAQGLGRGIRCETDSVRIWIADPRFPLPETLVRNPRRLLSQGKAIKHVDLAKGIPRRFANAYMASEIFYVGGKTNDAA